jgi:hypothetical protein
MILRHAACKAVASLPKGMTATVQATWHTVWAGWPGQTCLGRRMHAGAPVGCTDRPLSPHRNQLPVLLSNERVSMLQTCWPGSNQPVSTRQVLQWKTSLTSQTHARSCTLHCTVLQGVCPLPSIYHDRQNKPHSSQLFMARELLFLHLNLLFPCLLLR